jgi:hypothetical protein
MRLEGEYHHVESPSTTKVWEGHAHGAGLLILFVIHKSDAIGKSVSFAELATFRRGK